MVLIQSGSGNFTYGNGNRTCDFCHLIFTFVLESRPHEPPQMISDSPRNNMDVQMRYALTDFVVDQYQSSIRTHRSLHSHSNKLSI